MRKEIVGLVAGIGLAMTACAAESVVLVADGVAKCRVIIRADASLTEKLCKSEIEKYFAKATGCGALEGAYPIVLKIREGGTTSVQQEEDESFTIETEERGLTITGGSDRGLLYGTYELLKRHAGMRWITPGDDGEYCVLGKGEAVRVPIGKETQKPHLRIRRTIGDDINAAFWQARNGMQSGIGTHRFGKPGSETWQQFEALAVRGGATGGHIMTDLLLGGTPGKNNAERAENLMKVHPEWFPMIDGKRVPTTRAVTANPCISNPALLDHMAENLLKILAGPHAADDYITIGNNDTTVWCECAACKALDAPELKNTRGELADRYWFMVNEIAKRVWAKRPDIKLGGWAYQNFWYAPVHVRPDPRLRIMISFNNQCWRHTCDDPKCPVNVEMVRVYQSWKKLGHPLVINRDEIGAWDGHGSPGCEFEPSESILFRNMKAYEKIGCSGSSFCVNTPFPEFSAFAKNWAPFYGKRYHWYAMWQTCYMASKAMWNPDAEYEQTLEEANRLYYGAAWEGGMKAFRALLTETFLDTPGCIGWGQGATIGRCLDKPGREARLVALLDKAVAVAQASGDARTIKHVTREKEIFELTWRKAYKRYVESYREMTAYQRTGEITVDGALDEKDWQNADGYTNFALPSWLRKTFKTFQKTTLKVTYDREHLYFGVEAMEPAMDKVIAGDVVDRSATDCANLGNHIELWYSYPDMNQAAWHLMINSKGQIIDALQKSPTDRNTSIITKAKWAVKTYPDRWTLEVAIPCSEIGQNIMDGMTWKINCARVRLAEGMPRAEQSTAANGSFHGTANFVNVKFAPKRETAASDAFVTLVDAGVPQYRVVVAEDAAKPVKFGAKELTKYLGKATGDKLLPIRVSTDPANAQLKEDGFILDVKPGGIDIIGSNPRGAAYGCYEILKKYAGWRWLVPGPDGEYNVLNDKTVRVPIGRTVHNPTLIERKAIGDDENYALWALRNNMHAFMDTHRIYKADGQTLTADGKWCEDLAVQGNGGAGHMLYDLILWPKKKGQTHEQRLDEVFAAHPDWFPMINGKRVKVAAANGPNPCVSNSEFLDHLAAGFISRVGGKHGSDDYVIFGPNDCTTWCQCPNCKALDPAETKGTRGELSDRYWWFVNEVARRVWKTRPDIKIMGDPYQNYWYAPVKVVPDPRLAVCVSFNNQCWRHSCCDPNCAVNKEMVRIFNGWKRCKVARLSNRDEIGAWDGTGSPGCEFEPSETVFVKNVREYDQIGCTGSKLCINTPFPEFSQFATKWGPFYGKRLHWYAMWQTCYQAARVMWDKDFDDVASLEEANRLYYGAAWEPAMKAFRALLTETFLTTPGCIGWGQGVSIGRCLDKPGSEENLSKLLEKAIAAAKQAGDERALKHVLREKEIFEKTWLVQRKIYVDSYRELTAYQRTGAITVDGVLDEADWKNADSYSNFAPDSDTKRRMAKGEVKALNRTYMKVVYDHDHLYIAVEAMEPHPENLIASDHSDRFADGNGNLGDKLEVFYQFPDMGPSYWHLMINSKAQIIDALQKSATVRDMSLVTKAKWATKVHADRWVLELAIPCSEIGQNCFDGATWKVNVARARIVKGEAKEESSAANGHFHGASNFVNVKFQPKRVGTGAHDFAAWKNANLNILADVQKERGWSRYKTWASAKAPRDWNGEGAGETRLKEGTADDWYVHLKEGEFRQSYFTPGAGNYRITFRARGKGKVGLILVNYVNKGTPDFTGGAGILKEPKVAQPWFELTDEWKSYSFDRTSKGRESEHFSVRFTLDEDSEVDLDDIYVNPR